MKKLQWLLVFGLLSMTLAGCGDPCKENALTKLGDSIATIGKQGVEKDKVLAARTADRAAACAAKTGEAMKKKLGF